MKNLTYKILSVIIILIASAGTLKAQQEKYFNISGHVIIVSYNIDQNSFGGQYYDNNNQMVGEWVGGDFVITAKYENGNPYYGDLDFDVNIKREEDTVITDDNTVHVYMSGGSYTLLYDTNYDPTAYHTLFTWVTFP